MSTQNPSDIFRHGGRAGIFFGGGLVLMGLDTWLLRVFGLVLVAVSAFYMEAKARDLGRPMASPAKETQP